MEYSNEFLMRMIAAYYGAETIGTNGNDETVYITADHMEWLTNYGVPLHYKSMLLTPLSAITDEDAIEVAKIIGCNIPLVNSYGLQGEITYIVKRNDKGVSVGIYRVGGNLNEVVRRIYFDDRNLLNTEQADYLRSKAYDCGYAEIPSLIYAGLAIDKTTLNK